MSWLSEATGVHISGKGVRVEPKKVLALGAGIATGGALAPLSVGLRNSGVLSGGGGKSQPMDEQLPPVQIGTNPDGSPRYNPGQAPGAPQAGEEPGRFRRVMDFLSNHKDDIFDYGAAAEGIYDKYRQSKMQDEGLDLARGDFARRAPLRSAGMAGLLDNSRPDLSSVFSDPQNPTGRYRTVNVGSRR